MNYSNIIMSLVCLAELSFILKHTKNSSVNIKCYKSFVGLIIASIGMTITDIIYVYMYSIRSEYPRAMHIYHSFAEGYIGFCIWIWFIFIMSYTNEDLKKIKHLMMICNTCAIGAMLMSVSNSFTYYTSYMDENGDIVVKLSSWLYIIMAITIGVLSVGIIYAVKYYICVKNDAEKGNGKVILWIACTPLLFFIGLLLPYDSPIYSIMFMVPCLAFYFVHISDERRMNMDIMKKKEQLEESLNREKMNKSVINTIAKLFFCIYCIDLNDYTFEELDIATVSEVEKFIGDSGNAKEKFRVMCKELVVPKQADMMREFCNLTTLRKRIRNVNHLSIQFEGPHVGWCEGMFIVVDRNKGGQCTKVLWAVRSIQKEREYYIQSNTDELTGFYNRRAYESDIEIAEKMQLKDNFVYLLIDVNELKAVNDSMGHEAGDEIIKGASEIIRRCFDQYGKLYRIGGDEFVVLMYIDEPELEIVKRDYDRNINAWRGEIVERVSTSNGYALKSEFPDASIHEMAQIADKRMYVAKDTYYQTRGIDRRGQQAAYSILKQTYCKILRVNLGDDSFAIIKMDENEKNTDKGFRVNLSEWFGAFAQAGNIAEADRQRFIEETNIEKLKEYFRTGNSIFSIRYSRMLDGKLRDTLMEILPTKDYSDEKQEMFLFVKCL